MSDALWDELIQAWELAPDEVTYINRQQGFYCATCGARMRSMALAHAVMRRLGFGGPFSLLAARHPLLRVLEINTAGQLTRFLRAFPRHTLAEYPQVDINHLPYPDRSFDLVLHSDTLEHVPHPRRAIAECLRVTKPGGFLAFTVPIVYGRMSRSREKLPPSFHGQGDERTLDLRVETEFGADLWAETLAAGAQSCEFVSFEFPAGLAIVASPT
jgi:SAM-dependent methyltransferase